MSGTALYRCNRRFRHQLEDIAGFHPNVLYPEMTGYMIGYLTKGCFEIRIKFARFVAKHKVFKGIEYGFTYLQNILVSREH